MRVPAAHKMPLGAEAPLSSSVTSWLGHELELRGIDAVIYTRYILSILQQDDLQFDLQDSDFFPHLKKGAGPSAPKVVTPGGTGSSSGGSACSHSNSSSSSSSNGGGVGGGEKGARAKSRARKGDHGVKRRSAEIDSEKLKKSAAVECLLSVTDEDSGIETLVDELYLKLKEQQAKSAAAEVPRQVVVSSENYESSDSVISTSPEDPAERYYAAFPALSDKSNGFKPQVANKSNWAKMAQKSPPAAMAPKSDTTSDPEEFPDTVQDFEKLERDVGKAEALKRSKSKEKSGDEAGKKGRSRSPEDHAMATKVSPRQGKTRGSRRKVSPEERPCTTVRMTVDQIKGKAIFQDVEPEGGGSGGELNGKAGMMLSPVQSRRLQGYANHNVAFIVPKLKDGRSKSASRAAREPSVEKLQFADDAAKPRAKQLKECRVGLSRESSGEKSSGDEEVKRTILGSASRENLLWYMEPLDVLMPTSPVPKDRLYNRHQSASEEEIVKFVRCILSAIDTSGSDVKSDHTLEHEGRSSSCESERASTPHASLHSGGPTSPHNTTTEDLLLQLQEGDPLYEPVQFSFPWEEEAFGSVVVEGGSAAESPGLHLMSSQDILHDLLTSTSHKDGANKNADCDSGNETDDQGEGSDARPEIQRKKEVEEMDGCGDEVEEAALKSVEGLHLLDMMAKCESTPLYSGIPRSENLDGALSPQIVLPWILDLDLEACTNEEQLEHQDTECHQEQETQCSCGKPDNNHSLPHDTDTGQSPCRDLCSSPKDNLLLASEHTGIPTPQSTENEVLDDRPFFCISDTESQEGDPLPSTLHTWPSHQGQGQPYSPEVSSPNLSGLAYLWSEDQECKCGETSPQAASASLTKDSAQSVSNSGDTLICDITPPIHPRVLDSSSSSSAIPHQQLTSYATSFSGTNHVGLWPAGGGDIWCYPFPSIWSCDLYSQPPFVGAWAGDCPWNSIFTHISHHHYSMDGFNSSYSPQAPSFSPHLGAGLTSQIWDINAAQKRLSESPPERSGSLEKGAGYLWGLGVGWRKEPSPGLLVKNNLYQLGEHCWSLDSPSTHEIWHSALFDHADLMKQATGADRDLLLNVSLEPAHLFRNHSLASIESSDVESCGGAQLSDTESRLLPSENSAFSRESIPRRLPYLPHVQSEPLLSPRKPCGLGLEPGALKLVEVKHLYKSDTSILRELGLASDSDEEAAEANSEIEYSPDRHFHPIKTPVEAAAATAAATSQSQGSADKQQEGNKASQQGSAQPPALEVLSTSSSSSSRSSGYQLYQGDETVDVSFVPRFKIQKELEKSAQTGESPERSSQGQGEEEAGLAARLLSDMQRVLKLGEEDDLSVHDLDLSMETEATTAEYPQSPVQEMGAEVNTTGLSSAGIASLWEDAEADSKPSSGGHGGYLSIWSCGLRAELPSMPSDLVLGPSSTDSEAPARHLSLEEAIAGAGEVSSVDSGSLPLQGWSTAQEEVGEKSLQGISSLGDDPSPPTPSTTDDWAPDNDEVFSEDNMDFHALMFPGEMPQVPGDQAHYLSDLESTWLSHQHAFQVQVPGRRPPGKHQGQRKPCTFYMEGKCRRSDCKFAHDMSSITCRFWEEGACFKGITCPFLHGYPESGLRVGSDGDDDCLFDTDPQFSLEGEDFPALGASQEDKSAVRFTHIDSCGSKRQKSNKTHGEPGDSSHRRARGLREKPKTKSLPIDIKFKTKPLA